MIILFPLVGLWFWLSVLASFSWLMWAVHRDYYGYATCDLILVLALWSVTGNIPIVSIWHTLQVDPSSALVWVGGYLGLGVVWATVKWKLVLRKLKGRYDEWLAGREAWEKREAARTDKREGEYRPPYDLTSDLTRAGLTLKDGKPKVDVSHYRARITGWMAYWPASAVLWVLGDFLADVFDQLYRMVRGVFQKMADSEFS